VRKELVVFIMVRYLNPPRYTPGKTSRKPELAHPIAPQP
jgi:hypothetical protein